MKLLLAKLKASFKSVLKVLATPTYGLLATVLMLVVMWLFLWLFNLDLLASVLGSSRLDVGDKIAFALAGYQSLFTNFDSPQAVSLALFSVLSGINLSVLIYILRHGTPTGGAGGRNFFAATAALIGSGCAACGGSILAPLAAALGASISVSAARTIGSAANTAGVLLLIYSIYGMGRQAGTVQARERLSGGILE